MSKLSLLIILSGVLFLSVPALAEDLRLPYPDFKPGSPAYADSVDANFEALRTGINANSGKITDHGKSIAVNTRNIGANAESISKLESELTAHGHEPVDISPQGQGSELDADLLDGSDSGDFAKTAHTHVPSDLSIQGSGSGLDADRLDGLDSTGFAPSAHGHDERYTLVGHTHPAEEITGPVNAETLDNLDSSSFARADHAHGEYALSTHDHDANYAAVSHSHEDLAAAIGLQEGRIEKLEGYGDLSPVLEEIATLKRTVADLRSKVEELEKKLGKIPGN